MKLKITSPTVGKVEALGSITGIKRSGDYVMISTITTQPQGWDSETGVPTAETIKELDLEADAVAV